MLDYIQVVKFQHCGRNHKSELQPRLEVDGDANNTVLKLIVISLHINSEKKLSFES